MNRFPLSCQTITFGPDQNAIYPAIFRTLSECGYLGAEIGYRHVAQIPPLHLKAMLDREGLVLSALHVGGNLFDTGQAESEKREIDNVIEYAVSSGTNAILYSGLRYENEVQFNADLSMVVKSAEVCAEKDVRLLYHNHHWEFEHEWRIMNSILDPRNTPLGLCPDLGWVYRSGNDIVEFLEKARERIVDVHLKDFTSDDSTAEFAELGRGRAPFQQAAEWLKSNTDGMWVVLEQDTTELSPEEAIAINFEYGKKLFD